MSYRIGDTIQTQRGRCVVVDVTGDGVVVRYPTGEAEPLPIRWDTATPTKTSKRTSRTRPSPFPGFLASDFKDNVAGTSWRSERNLGGAVAALLRLPGAELKSHVIFRQPEVHWADASHRAASEPYRQGKLRVQVTPSGALVGFYIERPPADDPPMGDWIAFCRWLGTDVAADTLSAILSDSAFKLHLHSHKVDHVIERCDGNTWRLQLDSTAEQVPNDGLGSLIEKKFEDHWMGFFVEQMIPMDDAIQRGRDIIGDIAVILNRVMPLYAAVAMKRID